MSEKSSSARWIPFQCPACFGLFRIRKHQLGLTGKCPTCEAAVTTAAKLSVLQQESEEEREESKRELLTKVAVAQEMTPEELAEKESSRRKRKRAHQPTEGMTDWDQGRARGPESNTSWKAWVTVAMLVILVAAVGIRYITRDDATENSDSEVVLDEDLKKYFQDPRPVKKATETEEKDEVVDLVDRYRNFNLDLVEEAVRKFLTAETVEEKKEHVRMPERVGPLMADYYSKKDYQPEGFQSLNRLQVNFRGNLVLSSVQTGNFLSRAISLERVERNGEEAYLVDWESWVAYGEQTPEEMRAEKPTTPFVIRTRVEPEEYYNYGFSNDKEWSSYGLEMEEGAYLFLGYVKRGSELDKSLSVVRQGGGAEPFILKVAYPPQARAKDQVEILEIIPGDGWVIRSPEKEQDE